MTGKDSTIGAILLIVLIILLPLLCLFQWGCRVGTGVVDRVINPDAIIGNYEWYEQQFRDIKAAEGQIKDAEESVDRFKKDSGPSKEWRFDQREEYARLNSNLSGLKSFRRSLIESYNAKSSMITRNMWKSGTLPYHIEQ